MKLISLNIEGDKHLGSVLPFLEKEKADVLCIQESFMGDIENLKVSQGYHSFFKPICFWSHKEGKSLGIYGTAILSRTPFLKTEAYYYRGFERSPAPYVFMKKKYLETYPGVLLEAQTHIDGERYDFGTTHFTYSENGQSDEPQLKDAEGLLRGIKGKELVLCGDFNAPRANGEVGGEVHARFAQMYKDNIPPEVGTTLDHALHKGRGLNYVVDHLWTTPTYRAENVRVVCGVSDHCAIVADISKA